MAATSLQWKKQWVWFPRETLPGTNSSGENMTQEELLGVLQVNTLGMDAYCPAPMQELQFFLSPDFQELFIMGPLSSQVGQNTTS